MQCARIAFALALVGLSSSACGGSKLEAKTSAQMLAERDERGIDGGVVPAPVESVSMPITHLERQDVIAAVDAGLGVFLQSVETEPSLTPSRDFIGFRIVRLNEPDKFRGLGIGPGDVITSINEHPIERPTEAYEAFIGLKTAPSLEIDYLRGGRMMRLSLPIVGEPVQNAPKKEGAAESPAKKDETKSSKPKK